jgi:hypothetical protein
MLSNTGGDPVPDGPTSLRGRADVDNAIEGDISEVVGVVDPVDARIPRGWPLGSVVFCVV